ncbi:MAG: SsrA-binding protein SmpB [Candidatus Poribacteria bacterium]
MAEVRKIIENRRARHEYHLIATYEAGIALEGMEVKSLRQGNVSLQDSYAKVEDGQIFLYDAHISPYSHAENKGYNPKRKRRLLLHRKEIRRLWGRTQQSGLTLIPTGMHFNEKGIAKVSLSIAKGKHLYDKREDLKKEDIRREMSSISKRME